MRQPNSGAGTGDPATPDETVYTRSLWSPRGHKVTVALREGTSDLSVALSTFAETRGTNEDEYHLARYSISGRAVDVGAHIGTVSLAILADNPEASVVAVEPLAGNIEMFRLSLAANGWTDRATIELGAIGMTSVGWDYAGAEGGYERTNRYIGHLSQQLPSARQVAVVAQVQLDGPYDFVKFDCEGCEWAGALESVAGSRVVVGEWHSDPGIPELERIFAPTHDLVTEPNGATGLFWAVRR